MKRYTVEPCEGKRHNHRVVETAVGGTGIVADRELCVCIKEDDAYAIKTAMEWTENVKNQDKTE